MREVAVEPAAKLAGLEGQLAELKSGDLAELEREVSAPSAARPAQAVGSRRSTSVPADSPAQLICAFGVLSSAGSFVATSASATRTGGGSAADSATGGRTAGRQE